MALSKQSKVISIIVGLVIMSPFAWDLGRKLTASGIYRRDCQGTVVDTGTTMFGVLDFLDCSGSSRDRRRRRRMDRDYDLRGHYVAKIDDDRTGETYKVSISGDDFASVRPGQYVVCKNGRKTFYKSKAAYKETLEPETDEELDE